MDYGIGKCPICGNEVQHNKMFCANCGPNKLVVGMFNKLVGLFNEERDTLPAYKEKKKKEFTIADMADGEIGYTVPLAMIADRKGRLYISGNFWVSKECGGDIWMKIKKSGGHVLVEERYSYRREYKKPPLFNVGAYYIPAILVESIDGEL